MKTARVGNEGPQLSYMAGTGQDPHDLDSVRAVWQQWDDPPPNGFNSTLPGCVPRKNDRYHKEPLALVTGSYNKNIKNWHEVIKRFPTYDSCPECNLGER